MLLLDNSLDKEITCLNWSWWRTDILNQINRKGLIAVFIKENVAIKVSGRRWMYFIHQIFGNISSVTFKLALGIQSSCMLLGMYVSLLHHAIIPQWSYLWCIFLHVCLFFMHCTISKECYDIKIPQLLNSQLFSVNEGSRTQLRIKR